MVSQKVLERKHRSEEICKFEDVPINPHLPVIEDETTAKIRNIEEVAWRTMALCIVAVKGEGLEQDEILKIVEEYKTQDAFTRKEKEFIYDKNPPHSERVQFSWRYEGLWVLLWALSYIEDIERPTHICDVPRAVQVIVDSQNTETFIKNARLRSFSEILDATDLIYRYDWACVDASLNGKPAPAELDAGVIAERHHALNWLVGYLDQDWDDVITDT